MNITDRSDWGARNPSGGQWRPLRDIEVVHLHYSDSPARGADSAAQEVQSIQAFHMDTRGWDDIGYHFLVDTAGGVYKGRPVTVVGAETLGHNANSVGVCVLTDGRITDAAKTAVVEIITDLEMQLGRQLEVRPHSADVNTHCPGDPIREWIAGGMPAPHPPYQEASQTMFVARCSKSGDLMLVDPEGHFYGYTAAFAPTGKYLGGLDRHPDWHAGGGEENGPVVAVANWPEGASAHGQDPDYPSGHDGITIVTRDEAGMLHGYQLNGDGRYATPLDAG